jgi:hypothetical protein
MGLLKGDLAGLVCVVGFFMFGWLSCVSGLGRVLSARYALLVLELENVFEEVDMRGKWEEVVFYICWSNTPGSGGHVYARIVLKSASDPWLE